jgi:hypothetical protein
VVLLLVKNHHTTTTTPPRCDYNSGSSRQPRILIFGMQPYSNPTRRDMEDDLNIFENGRRPNNFLQRKMTSIFLKVEDNPKQNNATKIQLKVKPIIFLEMEDDLNFFEKGR